MLDNKDFHLHAFTFNVKITEIIRNDNDLRQIYNGWFSGKSLIFQEFAPKFSVAQMNSNFLPKFLGLK